MSPSDRSDLIEKNDEILEGTTCFAEHRKHKIPCKKTDCRYWHDMSPCQNCTIISADQGPKTLQEIGDVFGITRMRVCQIEKAIISKLTGRNCGPSLIDT